MGTLYINWHGNVATSYESDFNVDGRKFISGETLTTNASTSAASAAAPATSYYATVTASEDMYILTGTNPTATATSRYIPAGLPTQVAFGEINGAAIKIAALDVA